MATQRAYNFLEAYEPGGYERMIGDVLDVGGNIVQTRDYFLTFVVKDRVALVPFACGDLRKMLAFAHANRELFGYDAVEWTRQIGGKYGHTHRYKMDDLRR